ncbi:MAG: hypothetical protein MJZ34_06890 [Paludibacteraceae bacterium]|nr:hypothetical protein [Paludibacteraceae bacterium]
MNIVQIEYVDINEIPIDWNTKKVIVVNNDIDVGNYRKYIGCIVSVKGNVCLRHLGLKKLPIKFVNVSGFFDCSDNILTSLDGAPNEIGDYFDCQYNELTNLEGFPSNIGGGIDLSHNQISSLKGSPSITNGYFDCSYNKLKNLEGCPQKIDGWINCEFNPLISLKGAPIECSSFMYYSMNEYVTTEMLYMLNERYRKLKVLKNNYIGN